MSTIFPSSMQAVLLEENGKSLTVGQIPVLLPGPGQVLESVTHFLDKMRSDMITSWHGTKTLSERCER